jgi:predicted metal-binding membrane protein
LLVATAGAWLAVLWLAARMVAMPGTMGLTLPAFVAVWALMMAAMMLPSITPIAVLYSRQFVTSRASRTLTFGAGHLAVWAAAGVVAFIAAAMIPELKTSNPVAARLLAPVIFLTAGLYQLTPLKGACLRHCRSPISLLMEYASYSGRLRDFRAGLHHAAFCLGCCWALMLLLLAVGLMNLVAMVVLAIVVLLEKRLPAGETVAKAAAAAAFILALASFWIPQLGAGMAPMAG